jgi:hypothetical protein
VSDEFTVRVCRIHHRELHRSGDEAAWGRGSTSIRFQSRCGSGSTRGPMGSSLGARKARRRCTPRRPPTCQLKIEPARAAMHPPIPRALLQKMPTGSRADDLLSRERPPLQVPSRAAQQRDPDRNVGIAGKIEQDLEAESERLRSLPRPCRRNSRYDRNRRSRPRTPARHSRYRSSRCA